jgi:hypothetical protein
MMMTKKLCIVALVAALGLSNLALQPLPTFAETADIDALPDPDPCADMCPDLGDAPDSNNSLGNPMSIHPFGLIAQPAFFPTEFTAVAGTGPIHWNAGGNSNLSGVPGIAIDSALGLNQLPNGDFLSRVSNERNAFLLPDQDVRKRNIIPLPNPANGRSNRDGFDNAFTDLAGNPMGLVMQPCQPTSIRYAQFIRGPSAANSNFVGPRYINMWIDFNRDGDWTDQSPALPCPGAPNASVDEWFVRNLVAPAASGVYTLPAQLFPNLEDDSPMWLRISISEQPAPLLGGGVGPATGYKFGETEDHLMCLRRENFTWQHCPRTNLDTPGALDGEVRVAPRQPITFTAEVEELAVYPITVTWTIEGSGVSQVNPNVSKAAPQTAERDRLTIVRVLPASPTPNPRDSVVLGWYGCITCTLRVANVSNGIPLSTTINVTMVDADGNQTGDDMVVNVGWQAFVPVVSR